MSLKVDKCSLLKCSDWILELVDMHHCSSTCFVTFSVSYKHIDPSVIVGLAVGSTSRNPTSSRTQRTVKKSIKFPLSLASRQNSAKHR